MYYVFTWHETDGNDCTVYDTIVSARTMEQAGDRLHDRFLELFTENDCDAEEDGDLLGFYFPCDCEENPDADPDWCDGHGGTSLREKQGPFRSFGQAEEQCSSFHIRWSM